MTGEQDYSSGMGGSLQGSGGSLSYYPPYQTYYTQPYNYYYNSYYMERFKVFVVGSGLVKVDSQTGETWQKEWYAKSWTRVKDESNNE